MSIQAIKAIKMVYANTTKHDWPDDIWEAICQAVAEAEKQEPVIGTKTWFEDGKVVTQHLHPSDIYKDPQPKAEQEPVACQHKRYSIDVHEQTGTCIDCGSEGRMRFVVDDTYPQPKREWVGLADEEIDQGCKESWVTKQAWQSAVWWAEDKLKQKNGYGITSDMKQEPVVKTAKQRHEENT